MNRTSGNSNRMPEVAASRLSAVAMSYSAEPAPRARRLRLAAAAATVAVAAMAATPVLARSVASQWTEAVERAESGPYKPGTGSADYTRLAQGSRSGFGMLASLAGSCWQARGAKFETCYTLDAAAPALRLRTWMNGQIAVDTTITPARGLQPGLLDVVERSGEREPTRRQVHVGWRDANTMSIRENEPDTGRFVDRMVDQTLRAIDSDHFEIVRVVSYRVAQAMPSTTRVVFARTRADPGDGR